MDLTGFLFGNVNEEGELEDEGVLDKVVSKWSAPIHSAPPLSLLSLTLYAHERV